MDTRGNSYIQDTMLHVLLSHKQEMMLRVIYLMKANRPMVSTSKLNDVTGLKPVTCER